MMNINLDENQSILFVKPSSALKAEDFLQLTTLTDAYLKQHASLKGLIIETKKFPGWENLSAFFAHVKFVKSHLAKIKKIALVTDSKFADIAENFIGPFVTPQIKHFSYGQVELAKQWIE
ncbi:MAG: STAS/SEC14 domain-containing protein [Bacteroidia bacterium]